jgi:iron complex transport system substrate-binding protein
MLFALGLGDDVVAVTHECDFPAEATGLPRLTRSVVAAGLTPAEIDVAVREVVGRGEALYELDEPALAELEPDLIVTLAVGEVCAVSYDDVKSIAARLPSKPDVISLDQSTLTEVLGDVTTLATACSVPELGERLLASLQGRLEAVQRAVAERERPRVVALEWLDPPYVGGHWVPEMITIAGGADPLAAPGERSRVAEWDELRRAEPQVAVAMPCGYYVDDAAAQATAHAADIAGLGVARAFAVDAASSFSRPGPRLVDGIELLAHLLHPEVAAAPEGIGFREIAVSERAVTG